MYIPVLLCSFINWKWCSDISLWEAFRFKSCSCWDRYVKLVIFMCAWVVGLLTTSDTGMWKDIFIFDLAICFGAWSSVRSSSAQRALLDEQISLPSLAVLPRFSWNPFLWRFHPLITECTPWSVAVSHTNTHAHFQPYSPHIYVHLFQTAPSSYTFITSIPSLHHSYSPHYSLTPSITPSVREMIMDLPLSNRLSAPW